jgi:hypothetical protein
MTSEQFNEKYKDYLEKGHYGLGFDSPQFTEWLDQKFQEFIKKPGFTFSQIKVKFGMGRFYAENITIEEINEVESKITKLNNDK